MAEIQNATKGQANLNTVLGAIGTGLGVLPGIGNLLGKGTDPNDRPVTRYEMDLIRESMAKDAEIAALKGQLYTDGKIAGVQGEIAAQAVWNATENGIIQAQAQQLAQLYRMTKLMIPESNIDVPATSSAA